MVTAGTGFYWLAGAFNAEAVQGGLDITRHGEGDVCVIPIIVDPHAQLPRYVDADQLIVKSPLSLRTSHR